MPNSKISFKQLCLRGTMLKNTEFMIGIAVYTGHHTKLMKNAKRPKSKMSKVLRKMNQILISVSKILLELLVTLLIRFLYFRLLLF